MQIAPGNPPHLCRLDFEILLNAYCPDGRTSLNLYGGAVVVPRGLINLLRIVGFESPSPNQLVRIGR